MVMHWHSALERPAKSGNYLVCMRDSYVTTCNYSKKEDLFNWYDSLTMEPTVDDYAFNASVTGWAEYETNKVVAAIKRAERRYKQIVAAKAKAKQIGEQNEHN